MYLRFHMVRLSVSESSVDPSYDQFKLLPGLPESSSTRIDRQITFARLPTNGSRGVKARDSAAELKRVLRIRLQ